MDIYMEELLQTFRDEISEVFEELDSNLLELERSSGGEEVINKIFRYVHTLKGSANMMGFAETGKLAHALEDLLSMVRSGQKELEQDLIILFFESVDCLKSTVQAELGNGDLPLNRKNLINVLKNEASRDEATANKKNNKSTALDRELINKLRMQEESGRNLCQITIHFDELCPMKSAAALLAIESLSERGEILNVKPDPDSREIEDKDTFRVILATKSKDKNLIEESAIVPGLTSEAEALIKNYSDFIEERKFEKKSNIQNEPEKMTGGQQTETLRVKWKKLISLMSFVEELFVGRAKLNQAIMQISKDFEGNACLSELKEVNHDMDKLIARIQGRVMDVRRIPLQVELSRFNRAVRDLSREYGKKVQLKLECGDTEIDRGLWEVLSEMTLTIISLIVRDSIELPKVRRSIGKNPEAVLTIRSFYAGPDVVIEVLEDDKGLNKTDIEDIESIQEGLRSVRGRIEISSDEGKSRTIYRFRVPANSSTVKVLIVGVGKEKFALTLSSINEIIRLSDHELDKICDRLVLPYRGRVIPIRSLDEIFNKYAAKQERQKTAAIGVVVCEAGKEAVIEVDEIIGEDEILIKELKDKAIHSEYIQGVTILGNGRIIIILDHRAFL